MAETVKVGVAGLTHGHVWGLIDSWAKVDGASLVCVADATPLLDQAKERFQRSYSDWREMLDKEALDVLVVTSNNVESADIAVTALGKGISCFIEKAMAANAADADRILAAHRASGKTLMVNWPLAWEPGFVDLARRVQAGEIGKVFHLRYRNGHHGPKEIGCDEYFMKWLYDEKLNGGGAIADFCSYGAAVCRWLMGMPDSVFCAKGNYTKDYELSDDHALCVLKYPKASAAIEGTWATFGFDDSSNPVVHGKTGTLAVKGKKVELSVAGKERESVDAPAMAVSSPAEYFLSCMRSGTAPAGILNPEISADACRIVDAANRSAKSGCAEKP